MGLDSQKILQMRFEAEQFDFDFNGKYPNAPGFKNRKNGAPSKLAAESMRSIAPTLRQRCLEAIKTIPMTADEVAEHLDKSILSIRPRMAELAKLKKIEDSGQRRINESGKAATVWKLQSEPL